MLSRRFVTPAMLLGMALHGTSWAADSKPLDPNQAYAKKGTWAETMLCTRINCAEGLKGAQEGKLTGTPLPAVWRKMQADWPTECAWFYQDLPGVRYLDWFLQGGNPHFERWIMGRTLARIGGADAGLSEELGEMVRSGPPATDPQWLELYARARRFEDVFSICRRIWLGRVAR